MVVPIHRAVLVTEEVIKDIRECIELDLCTIPTTSRASMSACGCSREHRSWPSLTRLFTRQCRNMPTSRVALCLLYQASCQTIWFHGTSHRPHYGARTVLLNKAQRTSTSPSSHLGTDPASASEERSIDTSMGFTPSRFDHGTRSGDMDPAIIQYIMHKENYTIQEAIP